MAGIRKKGTRDRLMIIQQELDRLFAEIFEPSKDGSYATHDRRPEVRIDVFEHKDKICIRADVPGMTIDDLKLFVTRDLLIIEGKKTPPFAGENMHFLNLEREFGTIKREVAIPKPIDANNIVAQFADGVLKVDLPKISDRRGQRKPVEIK